MEILKQIQSDLLMHPDVPLSTILRKAKVLASQLRSEELRNWVSQELDGFKSANELPDYRVLEVGCVGTWMNSGWKVTNQTVPIHKIENEQLRKLLTTYRVFDGIRTVEKHASGQEQHFFIHQELTEMVNHYIRDYGGGFVGLELAVGPHTFEQILDTVKNRLLDFVLNLDENWHMDERPPSKDELSNLVSVAIYNHQGGAMGDKYEISGQAGAVGPNAHAHDNTFNQLVNHVEQNIDLAELIKQLGELRHAIMQKQDPSPEAGLAIGNVTAAELAAKEKNPSKVIEHLKTAGKWTLDFAKEIGKDLVVEVIKKATGMP